MLVVTRGLRGPGGAQVLRSVGSFGSMAGRVRCEDSWGLWPGSVLRWVTAARAGDASPAACVGCFEKGCVCLHLSRPPRTPHPVIMATTVIVAIY